MVNEIILMDNPDYYAARALRTGYTRATAILPGKGY